MLPLKASTNVLPPKKVGQYKYLYFGMVVFSWPRWYLVPSKVWCLVPPERGGWRCRGTMPRACDKIQAPSRRISTMFWYSWYMLQSVRWWKREWRVYCELWMDLRSTNWTCYNWAHLGGICPKALTMGLCLAIAWSLSMIKFQAWVVRVWKFTENPSAK